MNDTDRLNADLAEIAHRTVAAIRNQALYGHLCNGQQFKDIHAKGIVRVGDRKAEIDTPLCPLVEMLWEAGHETSASCQNRGDGLAYIQFLRNGPGGNWFHKTLQLASILADAQDVAIVIPVEGNPAWCLVTVNTVIVTFPTGRIADATAAVKHRLAGWRLRPREPEPRGAEQLLYRLTLETRPFADFDLTKRVQFLRLPH